MNPYNKSTEWYLWFAWERGRAAGLEKANQIIEESNSPSKEEKE